MREGAGEALRELDRRFIESRRRFVDEARIEEGARKKIYEGNARQTSRSHMSTIRAAVKPAASGFAQSGGVPC